MIRIDSAGGARVRRDINVSIQLAWTEGTLVFAAVPVDDVIAQINRWYGIDVRLGSRALAQQRFSGSYHNQSDSLVLRELALAIGARVTRRGGSVVLDAIAPR